MNIIRNSLEIFFLNIAQKHVGKVVQDSQR